MAAWPSAHDENVAQASCLQAGSLRYIFMGIFLSARQHLQFLKRFLMNDRLAGIVFICLALFLTACGNAHFRKGNGALARGEFQHEL